MEYGASIVSLRPFGRTDVVGGFDLLDKYLEDMSNQGAIVGMVANRIALTTVKLFIIKAIYTAKLQFMSFLKIQ